MGPESPPLRIGMIGNGVVASTFLSAFKGSEEVHVTAMTCRDPERGAALARSFNGRIFDSVESMLRSDLLDLVYVASPQTVHAEHTIAALEAGWPVLCEKPFAMSESEATTMVNLARSSGLFLMEALKTRFLPHIEFAADCLTSGEIGRIVHVSLPMGFAFSRTELPRLFDPERGGGARLDLGCYAVSICNWLYGEPQQISARSRFEGEVDLQTNLMMDYTNGPQVTANLSIVGQSNNVAVFSGTKGMLTIDAEWWGPSRVEVRGKRGRMSLDANDVGDDGLSFQVFAARDSLLAGRTEDPRMPHADSLAVMRTLDRVLLASRNQ